MFTRWTATTICIVLAAVFEVSSLTAAPAERDTRPNVILCMADDLGWGDVGFNGNEIIRTPHLDAMAAAGLRFNRFYAAAPVCSPTRASCLTGRHPYRQGIYTANSGHLRPGEWTLVELLGREGYATGHFGKWHLGTLTKTVKDSNRGGTPRGNGHYSPPWKNGFDTCFSTEAKVPTWDPLIRPAGNTNHRWWEPVVDREHAIAYGTSYWTNDGRVDNDLSGDDSRIMMDRAIGFLRASAEKRKPFLAVIWLHAPHLPVVAGPRHTQPYEELDPYTRHYYGCISALDEQIGRLRAELRTLGVAQNTMLWFCSDNGPEGNAGNAPGSAGPLRGRKRDLWEGGIRVPALLQWPSQVKAGSSTDVPATTSDYLPTVLEAVGIEMPDRRPLDGESLLPVISQAQTHRQRPIAFESAGQLALIDNRYKLLYVPPRRTRGAANAAGDDDVRNREFKLFDLIDDPAETVNLADRHPGVSSRLAEALHVWRASCRESLAGKDY